MTRTLLLAAALAFSTPAFAGSYDDLMAKWAAEDQARADQKKLTTQLKEIEQAIDSARWQQEQRAIAEHYDRIIENNARDYQLQQQLNGLANSQQELDNRQSWDQIEIERELSLRRGR